MEHERVIELMRRLRPELHAEPMGPAKCLAEYDRLMSSARAIETVRRWDDQGGGDKFLEDTRRWLLPALLIIEERYGLIPRQWTRIFKRSPSTLDDAEREKFIEVRLADLPQKRRPGEPPARDNAPGKRFIYFMEKHDIALGTGLARSLIEADGFVENFIGLALSFADNFCHTEETIHADYLNNGRIYNPALVGDGCSLFGDHPIDKTTYSNILQPAALLNEMALEKCAEAIRLLPDQAGIRLRARPRLLIVPIELETTAYRIFKDNKNPALPYEAYQVLDFLQAPKPWYVATSLWGLRHFDRKAFTLDLKIEDGAIVLDAEQSYQCGYSNPRGVFGSFPD